MLYQEVLYLFLIVWRKSSIIMHFLNQTNPGSYYGSATYMIYKLYEF